MLSLEVLLLVLVAVAGSSSMVGLIAWFHSRLRRLEQRGGDEQPELARELEATKDQVAQLAERLDFAERMLAKHETSRLQSPGS